MRWVEEAWRGDTRGFVVHTALTVILFDKLAPADRTYVTVIYELR